TADSTLPRGAGELILVVDDEDHVREVTRATLEKFGYRVIVASDGAEALAAFSKNVDEVALVLTDLTMPVIDGCSVIRTIRKINPAALVIAMSGLMNAEQVGELRQLKVQDILTKPFSAENLLTSVSGSLK
ncbi:MAG TPA: response regulator, partial [Pyrinomonadaceae bacterium]|nr:response regulator [Pyrinomonadaceae bacterium]